MSQDSHTRDGSISPRLMGVSPTIQAAKPSTRVYQAYRRYCDACKSGNLSDLKLLLPLLPEVVRRDEFGTGLFLATQGGHAQVVRALLEDQARSLLSTSTTDIPITLEELTEALATNNKALINVAKASPALTSMKSTPSIASSQFSLGATTPSPTRAPTDAPNTMRMSSEEPPAKSYALNGTSISNHLRENMILSSTHPGVSSRMTSQAGSDSSATPLPMTTSAAQDTSPTIHANAESTTSPTKSSNGVHPVLQTTQRLLAITRCKDGWTPLMLAAYHGYADVVDTLISLGADPNQCNRQEGGFTPLMIAAQHNQLTVARRLLATGKCDVNATTRSGATALMFAAQAGHAAFASFLLSRGADPNARRDDGLTALYKAVQHEHVDVVNVLLCPLAVEAEADDGIGMDMSLATKVGGSPATSPKVSAQASQQSFSGSFALARVEEQHRSPRGPVTTAAPMSPSLTKEASIEDSLPSPPKLSRATSTIVVTDVNVVASDGLTPLTVAVYKGNTKIAKQLLAAGANPNLGIAPSALPGSAVSTALSTSASFSRIPVDNAASESVTSATSDTFNIKETTATPPRVTTSQLSSGNAPTSFSTSIANSSAIASSSSASGPTASPPAEMVVSLLQLPIIVAASRGDLAMAELLLEHRATPAVRNTKGLSSLQLAAAATGKSSALTKLLESPLQQHGIVDTKDLFEAKDRIPHEHDLTHIQSGTMVDSKRGTDTTTSLSLSVPTDRSPSKDRKRPNALDTTAPPPSSSPTQKTSSGTNGIPDRVASPTFGELFFFSGSGQGDATRQEGSMTIIGSLARANSHSSASLAQTSEDKSPHSPETSQKQPISETKAIQRGIASSPIATGTGAASAITPKIRASRRPTSSAARIRVTPPSTTQK